MDVLDKFFIKYSYKFPKGYPDLKDKQDILLLESILEELGVRVGLNENDEIVNIITSSDGFEEYGEIKKTGKSSMELNFANVAAKGSNSDENRTEIYNKLIKLFKSNPKFKNIKRNPTGSGSSLGNLTFYYNNIAKNKKGDPLTFKIIVKGGGAAGVGGDTDVKEGLVALLYYTNFEEPYNLENYEERSNSLLKLITKGPSGLDNETVGKLNEYFAGFLSTDKPNPYISVTNQTLSSALTIRDKYPNTSNKILRTKEFDTIR